MDADKGNIDGLPALDPVLGTMTGLVLDLAPELGRWLFGTQAAPVLAATQAALSTITGSIDPAVQARTLADPSKASALRVELARIVAGQADGAHAQTQAGLLAAAANTGRSGAPTDPVGSKIAWGAAVVSLVVLLTFAAVMVVALTRTVPPGAEPVLNVLLGTLGAMATSVVGYWVGSSAGSARKEERLASLAERG